ncbi:CocE/NonD family hydrolase [Lentilactobacillus sunkii]|uniref:X-Pro dipeptidyl-peptidase domain protein n=1 Tax=Lentilactobacillus sunkii DSM 19904 TaxID=1423808 RepID=A0A0R1KWI7_9LACO|nr:CocE/NonD family hydrolase [Lentilactobacillus sunkii]KRK87990.1 X-Pro dipeptidyl-peptidase domain protein [Lentilactobacillus sunkii DSM 19904]
MKLDYYETGIKEATFSVEDGEVKVKDNVAGSQWQDLFGDVEEEYTSKVHFNVKEAFYKFFGNSPVTDDLEKGVKFSTPYGDVYEPTDNPHLWIQREKNPAVNLVVNDNQVVGFQVAARNVGTVVIQQGLEELTVLAEWQKHGMLVSNPLTAKPHFTAMVPMRDGVRLATEIFIPDDGKPTHSVVMERTPYGRQMYYQGYQRFIQRGFVVVLQDVRGRNDSEGDWLPMYYERDDGQDTIEWIAKQDWSNQKVGMIGGSYGGYVQWAAASSGTPYLKALVSMVTAGGPFNDTIYKGGAPMSGGLAWFFAMAERKFKPENMMRDDWDELMRVRPLSQVPTVGLGHEIPSFSEFRRHTTYDDFIQNMDWKTRADKITVPALIQSGWYDDNGVGTTEAIRATDQYPHGRRKIILGPWIHAGNSQYDLGPVHLGQNALRFDIDLLHVMWFEHFLNGVDNGIEEGSTVEYYTVNMDKWRQADHFPPNQQATSWYLDKDRLTPDKPKTDSTATFDYNPEHPTPHLIDISQNELEFPNDYAEVEKRDDVVSFTSNQLAKPLVITGWFKAVFYASSSAVNTDWVVRLTDVTPDGEAINIDDGVMNAIFHEDYRHPKLLTPGKVYQFEIETQKTSIMLDVGHQLRLDIASAANNLVFPNTNTEVGADGNHTVIAHQTIYGGPKYPSCVEFNTDND